MKEGDNLAITKIWAVKDDLNRVLNYIKNPDKTTELGDGLKEVLAYTTQGDTGHAQADMVMDLYSHILDEDRKVNAQKFEDGFYRQHMENYEEPKLTRKKLDVDAVLEKIKQDPELLSQLIDILSKD